MKSSNITCTDMFCGAGNEQGVLIIECHYCGEKVEALSPRKKYCSKKCSMRAFRALPKDHYAEERTCPRCGKVFPVQTRADHNRQYCSHQCSKNHHSKRIKGWIENHPHVQKKYNVNRVEKNPTVWSEKCKKERQEVLELLGNQCIVCGAINPHWLHVDYIPTTRGNKNRHPRHPNYIRKHRDDFRLLCANHHYELTLTGMIVGTDITQ